MAKGTKGKAVSIESVVFKEPSPEEQRRMAICHAARVIADATTAPARKRTEKALERAITQAVRAVKPVKSKGT